MFSVLGVVNEIQNTWLVMFLRDQKIICRKDCCVRNNWLLRCPDTGDSFRKCNLLKDENINIDSHLINIKSVHD